MEKIPNEKLFRDPRYQKLREQWCAGMLGVGYQKFVSKCEVGLNETSARLDADFFLKTSNQTYAFQITEVQTPGRKRGDEYKGFATGSIKSIPYEPEKGRIEGPTWLKEGIEKKMRKKYAESSKLNLLVYANFNATKLEYNQLKLTCAKNEHNFASIWINTSTHICSIYSDSSLGEIPEWREVRKLSDY